MSKPPLIVLVGPTAVGKSALAVELAEQLNGEVISADSRYFYRGMDIGAAKPSRVEMRGVPHHLIDVAEPDETWSLAQFQQAALNVIAEIHARGRIPLLVGGSGQYIRAVTQGWTPPEVPPNPRLRAALENLAQANGPDWLHDKLKLLDPLAAERIDARNVRRNVRALEVIFSTGKAFSRQGGQSEPPFALFQAGIIRPREELYRRIDARIESMFAQGFLEEVRGLLERGFSPALPSMSAIGYREAAAVLRGEMSLEEAKIQMKRITRIFVRRQSNWFKADDTQIHWFRGDEDGAEKIAGVIREQLLRK
ncbi:MAG: tRNA (adenosine(37)-N6)-dimethylallyltransferase MiaA [Anaerolineales bacterium]